MRNISEIEHVVLRKLPVERSLLENQAFGDVLTYHNIWRR